MIRVEGLAIRQGGFTLKGVCFEAAAGSYAVLMGATGSGKTTLLEVICGLRRADAGRVTVAGRDVTRDPPRRRGVGYVPQDGALFSTMRVGEQIGFPLALRGERPAAVRPRVEELAGRMRVDHLLDRYPAKLSGGERQRVALARALAARPAVLLLDEPLSALDESTREGMLRLLDGVRRDRGVTVLHVTHSRSEADRLGERLLTLGGGRVSSRDRPRPWGTAAARVLPGGPGDE